LDKGEREKEKDIDGTEVKEIIYIYTYRRAREKREGD
jgi:hypothetical protein